jgi:hypothetical protein
MILEYAARAARDGAWTETDAWARWVTAGDRVAFGVVDGSDTWAWGREVGEGVLRALPLDATAPIATVATTLLRTTESFLATFPEEGPTGFDALVGVVGPKDAAFAWAGAIAARVVRDGGVIARTEPHNGVRQLAAAGMPRDLALRLGGMRERRLGVPGVTVDHVGPFPVRPGDLVLVTTAAVDGVLEEAEILALCGPEAADRIATAAIRAGAPGDVTVLTVRAG